MGQTVIAAEKVGKRYRLGRVRTDTLRDSIASKLKQLAARASWQAPGISAEEFWALRDVSFQIGAGEVVGIIGRNGAGKSTLLKILSRITEPTTGRIGLRGSVASLLEVGTGFHPELTGRENVFLNGAILGMSRTEIRAKFDEIVAFADVERFLDTPVKHYSSGMYVRLAFAVAAHLEPEILIVDEVLAVGDAAFQKRCLGKLQQVAQGDGRTVLFVSHQMSAIAQLTQRCLLMRSGELAFDGPTSEAIERYLELEPGVSSTVFDVSERPRHGEAGRLARLLELRFERAVPQFGYAEPLGFVARVCSEPGVQPLRISVTIYANDGTAVGGAFSADHAGVAAGAVNSFRVALPDHRLAPGHYYCDVGIGRGNPSSGMTDYDSVAQVLQFEVLPPSGEEGTLSQWHSGWGRTIYPELQVERNEPR